MHVLMICALEVWALPSSGGAPTLSRTLRAYSERGHHVTFVTATIGANAFLARSGLRGTGTNPPLRINGVTFERFHLPSLQESRLALPTFAAKLDQKLRFALLFPRLAAARADGLMAKKHFDVLYGYEVHGALAAGRLLKKHRLPLITRFQGTVLYPSLRSLASRLRRYEEVQALRIPADLCIMTDDGTRGDDVLARVNPSITPKVRFWRNGLDMERLHPAHATERTSLRASLGLPRDALVLLTASRLATWKRVERAVAALPRVLAAAPNALLVILGDGEERANLEQTTRELKLEHAVWFVGAVPQERVVEFMQASDVLLALADLSNVGNPLLEAMACGLAIVTLDAGDTRDLIRASETGVLLQAADPRSVSDAIVRLTDSVLRERLGAAARSYAEKHFWTWDERLRAEIDDVERLAHRQTGRTDY